jgi:hypothetical protein
MKPGGKNKKTWKNNDTSEKKNVTAQTNTEMGGDSGDRQHQA